MHDNAKTLQSNWIKSNRPKMIEVSVNKLKIKQIQWQFKIEVNKLFVYLFAKIWCWIASHKIRSIFSFRCIRFLACVNSSICSMKWTKWSLKARWTSQIPMNNIKNGIVTMINATPPDIQNTTRINHPNAVWLSHGTLFN